MADYIPVVDVRGVMTTSAEAGGLVDEVGRACRESGFFVIVDHGLETLAAEVLEVSRGFFELSHSEKMLVRTPESHLALSEAELAYSVPMYGYQPPKAFSLARTHSTETGPPDLRENFSIAPFRAGSDPNRWPADPERMQSVCCEYYQRASALAAALREVCAMSLSLPADWFERYYVGETSTLTVNYYAPVHEAVQAGQLRAGAHTDFGGLTLLALDDDPSGLQVQHPDLGWIDVPHIPGAFVVNLGDLMAYWTGGRWKSTLHRVVLPVGAAADRARMSMPFFDFPNFDAMIGRIPTSGASANEENMRPIRAGDWRASKVAKMRSR